MSDDQYDEGIQEYDDDDEDNNEYFEYDDDEDDDDVDNDDVDNEDEQSVGTNLQTFTRNRSTKDNIITKPIYEKSEAPELVRYLVPKEEVYLPDSLERDSSESLKFWNLRKSIYDHIISQQSDINEYKAMLFARILANKYMTGSVYPSSYEDELKSMIGS